MSRIQKALQKIQLARSYSLDLLSNVPDADWYRQPAEGVTHVAWQAGHLAIAEFGLALLRVRGPQPEDGDLVPEAFRSLFGKDSSPSAEADIYPLPADIRNVMDRVHARVMSELEQLDDTICDEPIEGNPHPMFRTKGEALEFCPCHEFLHAGQIGLLRRLLGNQWLR